MSALADSWLRDATGARAVEFYAELGIVLPDRGGQEAAISCFSNPTAHKRDDRNASCSVSLTSGLWACHGCGQKGNAYQAALSLGYAEARAAELAKQFGLFLEVAKQEPAERLPDERKLRKWREALVGDEVLTGRLGELKGWTRRAIIRCGLGWNGERITFTIRDRKLKRVGVMLYHPNPPVGVKKITALPGTKRLLFPPPEVMSRRFPLYVVEGEACAVSVRSCGLQAVAVPGAGAWRPEFAQRLFPFEVVVLPDADRQGRDMAARVAAALPKARVVDLHPGDESGLDVGDWVAGASCEGGLAQVRRVLEGIAA